MTDSELLLAYGKERSNEAFAKVVERYLGVVYGSALRRLGGDAHAAQDVAQEVFARQAPQLAERAALTGWLFTTTRNVAAQWVRTASGQILVSSYHLRESTIPDGAR